ncbi:MAG: sugar phosphate isomerase/epimerase family protein [Chitinophagales bacterium]
MKFAICNELFEGWKPRRVVQSVAGLGYDGLEVAPFTLGETVDEITPAQRREFRAMAAEAGLAIVGLHWLLVKPEGLHLAHPDPQVRHRTIDYLRRLIDLCGDLGGTVMVFGSPKQRSTLPGVNPADTWKRAAEAFAACGDAAASRQVTLCLEPLPADLTDLLNTAAEARAMVREIGHPNVRMMLDVKSMSAEGPPIPQLIQESRGCYRHIHANDTNGRGPGFGAVDFRPILRTLAEEQYDGFVSVEVFDFSPDPETVARESLRNLRACLPE